MTPLWHVSVLIIGVWYWSVCWRSALLRRAATIATTAARVAPLVVVARLVPRVPQVAVALVVRLVPRAPQVAVALVVRRVLLARLVLLAQRVPLAQRVLLARPVLLAQRVPLVQRAPLALATQADNA
jgi:hypothetical protein